MAHINLYLYNLHQVPTSTSYPLTSIDTSVNSDTDAEADAWCGQGLSIYYVIACGC